MIHYPGHRVFSPKCADVSMARLLLMKCSNGHSKHPQLFAPSERRKAAKGKPALCMACQKARRKAIAVSKASDKDQEKKAKKGSAWRTGGHNRIVLKGTKF